MINDCSVLAVPSHLVLQTAYIPELLYKSSENLIQNGLNYVE